MREEQVRIDTEYSIKDDVFKTKVTQKNLGSVVESDRSNEIFLSLSGS